MAKSETSASGDPREIWGCVYLQAIDILFATPMLLVNIDANVILPKQYLKTIPRTEMDEHLFKELRYHPEGSENVDFILNQWAYRNSRILFAGDNFGCGSSPEHAA